MSKIDVQEIVVDGETYVKRSALQAVPKGPRVVLVVDRGWIFAGDLTEDGGRLYLDNAVWVFCWESIGFAAVVANPKQKGVDIRPLVTRVDVPAASEVFRMPVGVDWGK
jgi:uncharacterized protein with ACT and thioredoxin-like domain